MSAVVLLREGLVAAASQASLLFSGVVVGWNAKTFTTMHGGVVANLYIRHGSFWIDAISFSAAPLEVRALGHQRL